MPLEPAVALSVTKAQRVVALLRQRGAMSRGEIGQRLRLSRSTVSEVTAQLLHSGAIVVLDTDASVRTGSGRPAERLVIDPGSGQFLGVDFMHRRVRIAAADASHEILVRDEAEYAETSSWAERLRVTFDLIDDVAKTHSVHFRALHGVAIGVPGPRHSTAWRTPATHFDTAARFGELSAEVVPAFADRYGVEVLLDNNTRLAALAEAISGTEPVHDLIYVRLADGVGGGLVLDGRLFTGSGGIAGEIGHITVDPGGRACRCGKHGCLETVASVPNIFRDCREAGVEIDDLDGVAAALDRAHPVVDRILRDAGAAVGRAVSALAMGLNPAQIVVGGRIAHVAPVIADQVAATVRYESFPGAPCPVVRLANDPDGDGARGALAALFSRSPLLQGYAPLVDRVPSAMEGAGA